METYKRLSDKYNVYNDTDHIKIFGDGLNINAVTDGTVEKYNIQGFTINATLLRKERIYDSMKGKCSNYVTVLNKLSGGLPISMPVLCEGKEIIIQAGQINKWGENIYVKIPVIDTKGNSNIRIIESVLNRGIMVNITCVFTSAQVRDICFINSKTPIIVSVFSGRIADAGVDPCKIIWHIKNTLHRKNNIEILWASTREVYNIVQAIQSGCDIITVSEDILKKVHLMGKDMDEFSKETVQQFQDDSKLLEL